MTKLSDTDFVVLKTFADAMRPIWLQSRQHMNDAKKKLLANGVSVKDASDMLNSVLKQIKDEPEYVREG